MRGADLRARYEFGPGWNEDTLLDLLIEFIEERSMMDEALEEFDARAEDEMEMYASFSGGY